MTKRSYRQNCALARTADVIGERWTLLLLRDLFVAPRRFGDLERSLKGIGTNLLSTRLKQLESDGLVEQRGEEASVKTYDLTARGRALEPALLELIRWGLLHFPHNVPGDRQQDDWDLLALKAAYRPEHDRSLKLSVQFMGPALSGYAKMADGNLTVGLGAIDNPDILVNGTVTDLFLRSRSPAEFMRKGTQADLTAFMSSFAIHPQAST